MSFTVFYSWQSDLPNKTNRTYIEKAASNVLPDFAGSVLEEAPRLEKDTRGVPGTPRVTEAIFEKIDECGIFLADVSLVATTDDGAKKSPNPNVLLELGYAAKSIGWDRILLVMNTHFGNPDNLPFDLKERRFPICYDKDPDDETGQSNRKQLASNLGSAVLAIIQGGLKPYLKYNYKFFERSGNPYSPMLENLSSDEGKHFLKSLEVAKSKVEREWVRKRPQHEWDRFRRINDYAFRVFREMRFIQEKWFRVYDRYFQGLRTMPEAPSYRSDGQVQIEYGPTDQSEHWHDIGYSDKFAPVQLECHQYRGPRGDGFTVYARVRIRDTICQIIMHIGGETERSKEDFVWKEFPLLDPTI